MAEHDDVLKNAWARYCDRLKAAGDLILDAEPAGSELDRATGFQYLARQITKGLLLELEHKDPQFPQLFTLQTPVSKNFGDNPDCTYLVAYIDGARSYRLYGSRGTVRWVRLNTRLLDPATGLNYVDHLPPGPTLAQEDLDIGPDGRFEVTIGPDPAPGNWLRTEPGPQQLFIRQFFGDWAAEEPMRLRLERIGSETAHPAPLNAARVADGLDDAADFVERDTRRWMEWADFYRSRPNQFVRGRPDWAGVSPKHERQGGRWLNFCYFDLKPDEALIIEFEPPDCSMWIFEQNTYWMMSMDYRYHFSSLNSTQARVEADGSVRIVVADADPGVPNWLDTAGHRRGVLINRWVDPVENADPLPRTRVVPLSDLSAQLADGLRISPEDRAEQLRRLRLGVANRFSL